MGREEAGYVSTGSLADVLRVRTDYTMWTMCVRLTICECFCVRFCARGCTILNEFLAYENTALTVVSRTASLPFVGSLTAVVNAAQLEFHHKNKQFLLGV